MCVAFRTVFTVLVSAEVFEDAGLAEGVKTLVYGVGVSVEAEAKWAFQELVQVFLLDRPNKFSLFGHWITIHFWIRKNIFIFVL